MPKLKKKVTAKKVGKQPWQARPIENREYWEKIFRYCPDTGSLFWISGHKRFSSDPAGHLNYKGYISIRHKGRVYRAHRIIWAMVSDDPVPNVIDHIDRNPNNNRIENLRASTYYENLKNTGVWANNKSGYRGVSFDKHEGKYKAGIRMNGRSRSLGLFDKPEDAAKAYLDAYREKYGTEWTPPFVNEGLPIHE